MKPFVLTPRAEQDVIDIWDYVADDNIEAADHLIDALENSMFGPRIRALDIGARN